MNATSAMLNWIVGRAASILRNKPKRREDSAKVRQALQSLTEALVDSELIADPCEHVCHAQLVQCSQAAGGSVSELNKCRQKYDNCVGCCNQGMPPCFVLEMDDVPPFS